MLVDVKVEVFHSEARHWLSDRRIFYSPSRDHASSSLTNAIVNNISVTINLANNLGKKASYSRKYILEIQRQSIRS